MLLFCTWSWCITWPVTWQRKSVRGSPTVSFLILQCLAVMFQFWGPQTGRVLKIGVDKETRCICFHKIGPTFFLFWGVFNKIWAINIKWFLLWVWMGFTANLMLGTGVCTILEAVVCSLQIQSFSFWYCFHHNPPGNAKTPPPPPPHPLQRCLL